MQRLTALRLPCLLQTDWDSSEAERAIIVDNVVPEYLTVFRTARRAVSTEGAPTQKEYASFYADKEGAYDTLTRMLTRACLVYDKCMREKVSNTAKLNAARKKMGDAIKASAYPHTHALRAARCSRCSALV